MSSPEKNAKLVEIVLYPDPVLTKKARAITPEEFKSGVADGWNLKDLTDRMIALMYEAEGVGLAAPQVGVSLRLFVSDNSEERRTPQIFFNPVLTELGGTLEIEEGCLSLPDVRSVVKRYQHLKITAQKLDGTEFSQEAQDLMSRICQHETDHLDGILFTQKIGTAARFMLRSKMTQLEEEYEFRQRRKKK